MRLLIAAPNSKHPKNPEKNARTAAPIIVYMSREDLAYIFR